MPRGVVRSEAKGKSAVKASKKRATYMATLHTALTYCGLEREPVFGPRARGRREKGASRSERRSEEEPY